MSRDDIFRMAAEAGGEYRGQWDLHQFTTNQLERFAAIVAAHERELCAKVCEDNEVAIRLMGGKSLSPRFKGDGSRCDGDVYAAAIRARGTL